MVGRRQGHDSASFTGANVAETATATSRAKPLIDSSAYERTFIIAKAADICAGAVYRLRHPRFGHAALFHIVQRLSSSGGDVDDVEVDELLRLDAHRRSMFIGEMVVADGSVVILAPVHPLFLVLPYLLKAGQAFHSVEDFLEDAEFPAVRLLAAGRRLHAALRRAADIKELPNDDAGRSLRFYRYNETRLMDWLASRFEILRRALPVVDATLAVLAEDDLRRYAFGVLCDWLPAELAAPLRTRLDISEAVAFTVVPQAKRGQPVFVGKANDDNVGPPPAKTTRTKAAGQPSSAALSKKAQLAVRGTKSIIAFFSKKSAD